MCLTLYEIRPNTVTLPLTATPVVITNIASPYVMRFYEVTDYAKNIERINKKLSSAVKNGILDDSAVKMKLSVGSSVIVHNTPELHTSKEISMPMWWCRGILGHFNPASKKYNVLLIDYGIVVELDQIHFTVVSKSFISEAPATSVTGVFNVIPCSRHKKENSSNIDILVLKEWTESAIQFTQDLITASTAIHFDHLATDKNGRKYGEFYLNIDDQTVVLSEALVVNEFAIYLEKDLLQQLCDPRSRIEETDDDGCIRYAIEYKVTKTNNEKLSPEKTDASNQNGVLKTTNKTKVIPASLLKKKKNYNGFTDNTVPRLMIYSDTKVDPLEAVADARFPLMIHRAWETLVQSSRPRQIQSYMWPAMRKVSNVVVVGPMHCGKTIGYCAAIAAAVVGEKTLPLGPKPVALILCSTSSEVFIVHALCAELLQSYNIKTVGAYNGKSESSIVADMYNGCHILISTPCFLSRFIKSNKKVLSFKALHYLVLDNADVILEKYKNAFGDLLRYGIMTNRESVDDKIPFLRITIASRNWTPELKEFVRITMYQPYICISSFLEAAAFKSVKPTMFLVHSSAKITKLLDLLKHENCQLLRIMILCTCAKETEELNRVLSASRTTLLVHENMTLPYLNDVKECWETYIPGFCPILICTDDVLADINVTNIDWLIHYSVALDLKSQFSYRFSVLMDNLSENNTNCKVSIIADEQNNLQFLGIIQILQRLGIRIQKKILDGAKRIAITLDQEKKCYTICSSIQAFGECQKKHSCDYRHCILPEVDTPKTDVNIGDKVKLMIMYVHNATHFSARLMELTSSATSEKRQYSSNVYMQLSTRLQQFYSIPSNKRTCHSINVGNIYATEEPIGSFKRVQVLHIRTDKVDRFGKPKFADIKCVENGFIFEKFSIHRLWELPEDILNLPTFTVDVFLANIAPYDNEPNWNLCADEATANWFKKYFKEGTYVQGTVCLHLGNTIWTNDLEVGTKLIGYDDIVISSLKSELIDNNYGVVNDNHMTYLYKLCKSAGLNIPGDDRLTSSSEGNVSN